MECVFCNHNQIGEGRIIYKDDTVIVFPTNIPITPGHTVICPIRHVQKIDDVTPEELQALQSAIVKIKAILTKAFDSEGFNIAFNEGAMAGQTVPHLHIHVVPRKTGDTGIYEYEPRKFLYRPGSREESPEAELNAVADLLRELL